MCAFSTIVIEHASVIRCTLTIWDPGPWVVLGLEAPLVGRVSPAEVEGERLLHEVIAQSTVGGTVQVAQAVIITGQVAVLGLLHRAARWGQTGGQTWVDNQTGPHAGGRQCRYMGG